MTPTKAQLTKRDKAKISPWQEIELVFTSEDTYSNPYLEVDMWVDFTHIDTGYLIRRPAFWDGSNQWKVRFTSPGKIGTWSWQSATNTNDTGLNFQTGQLYIHEAQSAHAFYKNGFWRMSSGARNLVHANGKPALLCGDTAWALPWRATLEQTEFYAKNRQSKGFNAVLMMVIQPDMQAEGPNSRKEDYGFARAFDDLPEGHLTKLIPEYFQYLDRLIDVLIAHELVPVYQPAFHGYGWKGKSSIGAVLSCNEAARFSLYLVARYGARPAIYLIGADGYGDLDSIRASGEIVQEWDSYNQPTGIHYNPMASNHAWQDCDWLDFQWCQTGHGEEHMPERVMDMWHQSPPKAVCNAEPTYERMNGNKAQGWWQGHEAWSNLCAGGTMGTVYGAASLWQWRLHKNEPGHGEWSMDSASGWREALDFEGSSYPGILRRILEQYDFTDMRPDWQVSPGKRGLFKDGVFYLCYQEKGDEFWLIHPDKVPTIYTAYCARTGLILKRDKIPQSARIPLDRGRPIILVCGEVT